jgi:hypothetical protein
VISLEEGVSSSAYNHVQVDSNEGVVTKSFMHGDRAQRCRNEVRALEEVPNISTSCMVPAIIDYQADAEMPWIKTAYLPAAETLDKTLQSSDISAMVNDLSQALGFMEEIHSATNGVQGIPQSLHNILLTYQEKHGEYLTTDVQDRVVSLADSLPEMQLSQAHHDFKLANLLVGEGLAVIDWEHYGQGAQCYDSATLFVNALLHLHAYQRLDEALELHELPLDTSDLSHFYINAVARTLVEYSPVIQREEFGPRENYQDFMGSLLDLTLKYAANPAELRQFIGEVIEVNGSG